MKIKDLHRMQMHQIDKEKATLVFSAVSVIMTAGIFGFGIPAYAQETFQNGTMGFNNMTVQSQNGTELQSQQQQQQNEPLTITAPDPEIIVLAEDLFEIRDNLAEAREALNRGNYVELAQHIQNLDQLVTVMINPLPTGTSAFEQRGQQMQQMQQQSEINSNTTG